MYRGKTVWGYRKIAIWWWRQKWGDASIDQQTRIASKPPEARRGAWATHFLRAQRRKQALISDFWPPKLSDNKCLFSKLPSVWHFVTAGLGNQKIAGRNINSFRYADDTILIAESETKLGSPWRNCLQSSVCPSEGVHATRFEYKKLFYSANLSSI